MVETEKIALTVIKELELEKPKKVLKLAPENN
jgi:hypothetical protein